MTRDELEFQISQYLDGTLAAADQSALEQRLASDVKARDLLGEYQRLDGALKSAPLPSFDLDQLGDRICAAVAEVEVEPARTYRIGFVRTVGSLALAASVLLAIGFGVRLMRPGPLTGPGGTSLAQAPTEIEVVDSRPIGADPGAPVAPSTAGVEVAVGPSKVLQDEPA